jgi:hypothetical protein
MIDTADGTTTVTYSALDNAGNASTAQSVTVRIDRNPPTTTAVVSGMTVTLSSSDSFSGVKATAYTVDGGPEQTYSAPFTLPVGHHTVVYWSVDLADNEEAHKTLTVVDPRPATTLTIADASGKRNAKVTLSVTLTSGGTPVAAKTIAFLVDGAAAGSGLTGKNGKATVTYTIPKSMSVGAHPITGRFAGDSTYKPSSGTGTLTVK